jgi:hypothetical protein
MVGEQLEEKRWPAISPTQARQCSKFHAIGDLQSRLLDKFLVQHRNTIATPSRPAAEKRNAGSTDRGKVFPMYLARTPRPTRPRWRKWRRGSGCYSKVGSRSFRMVETIHHKLSASRNPDRHDRVIMVSGKRAGTEENWVAYLDFNDATQNNPPVIEPDLKTLYIFYPERFFPMVDEILRSPFTTPICLVDLSSHPFGSVEASGPMPFRR